jgi:peptide/nickel transport system substrate-binding protein
VDNRHAWRTLALSGLLCTLLASCAPSPAAPGAPGAPGAQSSSAATAPTGPTGTLRIAWGAEPPLLAPKFINGGSTALAEMALTFNSALTYLDPAGIAHPQLASEIPSQDNGSWVINADGTMITTYHIRDNAKWHDGHPLTANDFAFAFQIYRDPDVPVGIRTPENSMASVEAKDDRTLEISWKQPYYAANALWYQQLDPLPRHLLEEKYLSDKPNFMQGPEWTTSYIGSGPFRLEKWNLGSGVVARAFTDWVLGPPKIATLDIRFFGDGNTILANLLAGETDVSGLPWLTASHALSAKDQWVGSGAGTVQATVSRLQHMDFQFRDVPSVQPLLTDVRVRQALMYATDRQGLADRTNEGLGGGVADIFLLPTDALYREVDQTASKYPYDPARAEALMAEVGYRRPQAGSPLVNGAGQPFAIEVWGTGESQNDATIIARNWQDVGMDSRIVAIPPNRAADGQYRTSFTGVSLTNHRIVPENFIWTSSQLPTAQNQFAGQNRGSFADPEIDRLQRTVLGARGPDEWRQATLALHGGMSKTLGTGPLYYPVDIMMVRSTVAGPQGHYWYPANSWNIFEWTITG